MFRRWLRKKPFPIEEIKQIETLEKSLGYVFADMRQIKRALSHKSYANEKRLGGLEHNERLEFLGDAVLELGISDILQERFPQLREGDLSKIRASLVNETALAEQARKINLGSVIFLGRGEDQGAGREKNSLLSDAFEAVLGAVYLDGGFAPAYKIIRNLFLELIDRAATEDISRDYKTKLQEDVQTRFKAQPEYRLVSEEGPDHAKIFQVELIVRGEKIAEGSGRSKKQAEQSAAQMGLAVIQSESEKNDAKA